MLIELLMQIELFMLIGKMMLFVLIELFTQIELLFTMTELFLSHIETLIETLIELLLILTFLSTLMWCWYSWHCPGKDYFSCGCSSVHLEHYQRVFHCMIHNNHWTSTVVIKILCFTEHLVDYWNVVGYIGCSVTTAGYQKGLESLLLYFNLICIAGLLAWSAVDSVV